MALGVWGLGWILVFIAVLNSIYANAQAGTNGGSRVIFAMGRARLLPHVLSRTHPILRSPRVAIVGVGVLNAVIALAAGLAWGGFNAYFTLGELQTLFFIGLFIVACLAVPVYYYRFHREEFGIVRHALIPLAGAVLFGFPIYYSVVPMPSFPISVAPFVALGWLVLGLVVLVVLRARRPEALDDATRLYLDEP